MCSLMTLPVLTCHIGGGMEVQVEHPEGKHAVARQLPSHLKLHADDAVDDGAASNSQPIDLAVLMRDFANATGWLPRPLGGTPHHPPQRDQGEQRVPLNERMQLISTLPMDGLLDVDEVESLILTDEASAWALLEQIDALVQKLEAAEKTIERQEAQLATQLGVSIRQDESEVLVSRLQESLERCVELTGSDAAAVYLLDESTSDLKMRCCWGLGSSALSKPARPLRGALADLEALMGNAVLLENTALAAEWSCPEHFAAGMCVPIGSPTMPHGTLWLWSSHIRDFSSAHIDAAKAAADKVLVDIERSVLADEVLRTRGLNRQVESASLVQSSRLPSSQPLHADYEIGGWTFQGQALGGNFHTWTVNRHEQICAALGSAVQRGPAGALVSTSVQTVVETCWNSRHRPSQILRRANDLLWESQDGDWRSSLCYLQIHPESGSAQLAQAGNIQAFLFGEHGFRMLGGTPTLLAQQPDTAFQNQQLYLEPGELLVIASADVLSGAARGGLGQDELLQVVQALQDEPVDEIVSQLARQLPMVTPGESHFDRSLLILRRRF